MGSIGLCALSGLVISWTVRGLMTQFPRLSGQWKYEIDYTEKQVIDQLKTGNVSSAAVCLVLSDGWVQET